MFLILVLFVAATSSETKGQVTYNGEILRIQNDKFIKVIQVSRDNPRPVWVRAMQMHQGENALETGPSTPYFEFVINQRKVTAHDPVWQYAEHRIRNMGNGGTEVIIRIKGVRGVVRGLELHLYQQIFTGTTLMREKLSLHASGNRPFALNKLDGKLHFIFPAYGLPASEGPALTEIRIASYAEELIDIDEAASSDERFFGGRFSDHNLAHNHMFHPKIVESRLEDGGSALAKGPIQITRLDGLQWITAYEHASQDNLRGLYRNEVVEEGGLILDAAQGTSGVFDFPVSSSDFFFLGIQQEYREKICHVGVKAMRGAYLDGERIDARHPYESVWTATAFDNDPSGQRSKEIIHDYLWRCICEQPAAREPDFYYNTWGMQRRLSSRGHDLRGVLTVDKIKEEIGRAAEMGVDIFVLDDGWEQTQGDWTPHKERLPDGLAPIKAELDRHGIKMGIWLSPMGIDSTTQRYKDHPEWVIKDSEGNPIGAQWRHPAFDFVSDFYDLFIEDCKKLVDAGARFFKWDAINTFYSTLPNLHHGSDKYPEEERRARYEYLLPVYVTRAMAELTEYEPELVIEVDLTEARRVMTGLAPLSQGKLFWMNNGASGYNDYSSFRAKSMRTIPNRYAGIIPLELFTYANYPHSAGRSMRYNVNTSLVAGHGFWGALEETSPEERAWIGKTVGKCQRILPYIGDQLPEVIGRVGASPEIYTLVNGEAGAGQVIAFSGSAMNYHHRVEINDHRVLGVLNHAWSLEEGQLILDLDFPMPEATREAFIIPNELTGISIRKSTCWLDELSLEGPQLVYVTGAAGAQEILWDAALGKPSWEEREGIDVSVEQEGGQYLIRVHVDRPGVKVALAGAAMAGSTDTPE